MRFWKRHDNPTAPEGAKRAVGPTESDVRRAYERGRRDERARHKGHPVMALMVFVLALVGAGLGFLAAREGSFGRGGEVVDQKLAVAAGRAGDMSQKAAYVVTQDVQSAGQSLRDKTLNR